jgi:hypothetical protein
MLHTHAHTHITYTHIKARNKHVILRVKMLTRRTLNDHLVFDLVTIGLPDNTRHVSTVFAVCVCVCFEILNPRRHLVVRIVCISDIQHHRKSPSLVFLLVFVVMRTLIVDSFALFLCVIELLVEYTHIHTHTHTHTKHIYIQKHIHIHIHTRAFVYVVCNELFCVCVC